jgi:hypothetical protein
MGQAYWVISGDVDWLEEAEILGDDMRAPERDSPEGITFQAVLAMFQEADRRLKETNRQLGNLNNRIGKIVEGLMSPQLDKKFEDLGFSFINVSRNHAIKDYNKQRLAEIDVFLESGEYAMAVEVKVQPSMEDVRDHVKRMGILRQAADNRGDKRKYLGAVAGTVMDPRVLDYALKKGFFVIIPSGDTVDIAVPAGFKPRVW